MTPDIMRLVVDLLPLHDVQSTMLVCREWQNGFANGLLELKPRRLRVSLLATRYTAPSMPFLALPCLSVCLSVFEVDPHPLFVL